MIVRKIVIALIVLNVLYFLWVLIFGKAGYTAPSALEEGIPSLTLLPTRNTNTYQSGSSGRQSSCYAFGPLNSEKTANIIARKVNGFGLATRVSSQETMQTLNFLVYLQPFASRQEAIKVIEEMSKHEIKEYKIVESGPYQNAIALGSFNNLNRARRHAEYVRFLGYDARYTTQKKRKEVYWVNYDEPFGTNAPIMRWITEIDPRTSAQKIPKACAS